MTSALSILERSFRPIDVPRMTPRAPTPLCGVYLLVEGKAIGEFVSDRMRVLREEPDADESHVPEITQAQRDEWREVIQRRMRGRVRQPRSVPVGPIPEGQP